MNNSPAKEAAATCTYCHLPLGTVTVDTSAPAYCCLGCRLAAEVTGQSGQQGAAQWALARLGLAIFLSLNVMMFTMALWTQDLYDARGSGSGELAASLADLFRYLCLVLSLPVLFLLGGPLFESALAAGRKDVAAADLLILAGVIASYVYSAISVVRGAGHVYFEVGCAVLVMVTLGRWLEATGKLRTTAALEALEKLLPAQVRIVDATGTETLLPTGQLCVGHLLRVLPGERVATDGMLVRGRALIDQQVLTGESRPTAKSPGDELLGGTLNLDGDLLIEVRVPPAASSLAKVVELVRAARNSRGRYQRLADRVARAFLPAVVLIALTAFAYHWQRTGIDEGVLAGLAVLLIACPCALGLATPMAVWAALGAASRAGVLVRNGEALERLATIRAVRFDKTGTLTTGAPTIAVCAVANPNERSEVLSRARRLANGSTHIFSQSIVDYAGDGGLLTNSRRWPDPVVCTAPGRGVLAQFANDEAPTRLGSVRWLGEVGLKMPSAMGKVVAAAMERGDSVSALGWNGQVRGVFVFAESLRPGAGEALGDCAALGCDVAVLTGDHRARAAAIERDLGVSVVGELLPQDKVTALRAARDLHGPVAMVGDGINDAPALAASDLGIALGCGADVSRESAAICLATNDLALVPWTIALSRQTVRIVRQNLFWAFAYNTLGIALAAAGWLNPAWAAAAMVVSSSLVITNSLRLSGQLATPGQDDSESSMTSSASPVGEIEARADLDEALPHAVEAQLS